MMKLVVLGPPGAGKGTQCAKLAEHFGVPRISTGDILRRHVAEKTDLGKKAERYMREGRLVPDDLVIQMVRTRLAQPDAAKGFVLDGFPRTREQATALGGIVPIDRALLLFLDPEDLIKRSTGRRVCRDCEAVYHVAMNAPRKEGVCDQCGGPLITRDDDQEETVRHRIQVYDQQTAPLVAFYKEEGHLVQVYGSGLIDEVFHRTLEALGAIL